MSLKQPMSPEALRHDHVRVMGPKLGVRKVVGCWPEIGLRQRAPGPPAEIDTGTGRARFRASDRRKATEHSATCQTPEADMQHATDLAPRDGSGAGASEPFGFGGSQPYSEATAAAVDAEVRRLVLEEGADDALRLLRAQRRQLAALAAALLDKGDARPSRGPAGDGTGTDSARREGAASARRLGGPTVSVSPPKPTAAGLGAC
jgi:hypothetical protein